MSQRLEIIEGEHLLGRYTVVILQKNQANEWTPSVMQLDTSITNYRLYLRPMHRRYAPATLPVHMIRAIQPVIKNAYHCIEVTLLGNAKIYLMLATGRLEDFYDHLVLMKTPPLPFVFDEDVARHTVNRLIHFFKSRL